MMLDDLQKVMPPPLAPIETPCASWQAIEAELGTLLPEDYKSFVEAYGSGRIGGFIWILNRLKNGQLAERSVNALRG